MPFLSVYAPFCCCFHAKCLLDDVALHLKGFLFFFIFQLLFIIHAPQSRLNVAPLVVVVAIVCCCCCCCCAVSAPLSDTSLALALRCAAEKKLISRALGCGGREAREGEREGLAMCWFLCLCLGWVSQGIITCLDSQVESCRACIYREII